MLAIAFVALAAMASVSWVQWVKGQPLSPGGSQAKAMISQICSGSNVGDASVEKYPKP